MDNEVLEDETGAKFQPLHKRKRSNRNFFQGINILLEWQDVLVHKAQPNILGSNSDHKIKATKLTRKEIGFNYDK